MKYLGLKQLICHVQSTWNVWAPVTGLFPLCSVAQTCKACRPGNSTEMGNCYLFFGACVVPQPGLFILEEVCHQLHPTYAFLLSATAAVGWIQYACVWEEQGKEEPRD